MKVIKSLLWHEPLLVLLILGNCLSLDPLVLLHNPVVYVLKNKHIVSCCAIVNHNSCKELKSVYTHPRYRRQGFSTQTIKVALKNESEIYLVCKKHLRAYYEKLGFVEVISAPRPLSWKKRTYNRWMAPCSGVTLHIMKRTVFKEKS